MLAGAQESLQSPAPQPPTSTQLEQVVITGSRIPLSANEGPQEVQIYSRDQMEARGGTTLADFLNTLPDVSVSIAENGFQTLSGTTTVQLHGLPVGTTLILVNGRRVETSGAGQAYGLTYFDLNTIPVAAIDRIELVSQGSSAVYGSDAIAGVINIILKKSFNGFEANGKYGFADDTHETGADVSAGRSWDKGSVVVTGSYLTRSELPGYDRALPNDNNYVPYGGRNADLYMCPDQADIYSLDGADLPQLGAAYAAVPAGYTGVPSRQEFASTAGSLNRCSLYRYASQLQGTERASLLVSGTYEPSPTVAVYGDVLFSHVQQYGYNAPPILYGAPGFQQYTVGANNPFNPFGEAVGVSEMLPSLGREVQDLGTNFLNAVVGARGSLSPSWSWDVGISDSEDRSHYTQPALISTLVQAALNSSNPNTALNPFVAGPPGSATLLRSFLAQDYLDSLGRATVLNTTVRGPLLSVPAGALQLAVGGEYERDTLFQDQFYFPGPGRRTNFHRKIYAFFAESRLPVIGRAAGSSSGDRLTITLAGRFDHDDQFGGKWTPQVGVEIRPLEPLLLRASYSRAFRAPDLIDLYAANSMINGEILDPLRGNAIETARITLGGNPTLKPERGLSRTVELAYSSPARPELRLAITWWNIEETNGIQQLQPQLIVDNAALFPGAVTRANSCQGPPPCQITAVTATYLNFGSLRVSGLDYRLSYEQRTDVGTFAPSIAATQTYRYDATLTPSSPATNAAGAAQDTGNWSPRWKGTLALDWHLHDWSAYLAGRYVGRYRDYDSTATIGNFWLVDASVRYAIGQALAAASSYWQNSYLRIGAVNLFNKLPQFSNHEFDIVGYDPAEADIRGRFLYAQLGVRW